MAPFVAQKRNRPLLDYRRQPIEGGPAMPAGKLTESAPELDIVTRFNQSSSLPLGRAKVGPAFVAYAGTPTASFYGRPPKIYPPGKRPVANIH
jgi:hypothetical protein